MYKLPGSKCSKGQKAELDFRKVKALSALNSLAGDHMGAVLMSIARVPTTTSQGKERGECAGGELTAARTGLSGGCPDGGHLHFLSTAALSP